MHIMVRFSSSAARVLGTLAAAVVVTGCAMKGDVRDLQQEIRALAARQDSLLAELRQETQSTRDTLRTQSDQMFDFRGDLSAQLRQIGESLRTLEALAGENQRGIAGVRDQLANLRRLPVAQGAIPPPDTATAQPGGEQLVGGARGNADQLWSVAIQQYDRESLNAASMAFQQFLDEYPGDERGAEAHFYLADILEQQDRPEDALEAFGAILELHPTHEQVPSAMYRMARLHRDLGDTDAARELLERIMNTYPEATISMLAREMLEEIG